MPVPGFFKERSSLLRIWPLRKSWLYVKLLPNNFLCLPQSFRFLSQCPLFWSWFLLLTDKTLQPKLTISSTQNNKKQSHTILHKRLYKIVYTILYKIYHVIWYFKKFKRGLLCQWNTFYIFSMLVNISLNLL